MRISNIFTNTDHYNNKQQTKTLKHSEEVCKKPTDTINLSNDAKDFQTAFKSLSANSDVNASREDRVNSIKEQIKNGTYNISATDIANKIMQD